MWGVLCDQVLPTCERTLLGSSGLWLKCDEPERPWKSQGQGGRASNLGSGAAVQAAVGLREQAHRKQTVVLVPLFTWGLSGTVISYAN